MKFATRAIHAGQEPDPSTGAVMTPIFQTSTYAQAGLGENKGYEYSRSGNPTRSALEQCLAELEGGQYGLAFASGLAAENTVLSLLSAGDHLLSCDDLYGGTYRLFERVMKRYKVDASYLSASASMQEYEKAIRPNTKLLWLETPTNPLLSLVDIRALAEMAHRHKLLVVVDNTFASPYFQQPLQLGHGLLLGFAVVRGAQAQLGGRAGQGGQQQQATKQGGTSHRVRTCSSAPLSGSGRPHPPDAATGCSERRPTTRHHPWSPTRRRRWAPRGRTGWRSTRAGSGPR